MNGFGVSELNTSPYGKGQNETHRSSSLSSEINPSIETKNSEILSTSVEETECVNSEIGGYNNSYSEGEISSQKIAEEAHEHTKEDIISEYGEYMSPEHISTLESDETKEKLTVMSSDEYTETFPDVDVNVLGHCDSEGNIYMKDVSPEITEHVSTHETMHLCANREIIINDDGSKTIISGLRESRLYESGKYNDYGMGVNEGTTEMYTMRELKNRGEYDAAYSVNAYSEARMWSERIEKVVGEDKMAEAYFGGKRQEFKDEFNRLNGYNSDAWDSYSKDIETIQFSDDPAIIHEAKLRVTEQFRIMVKNKYGIEME